MRPLPERLVVFFPNKFLKLVSVILNECCGCPPSSQSYSPSPSYSQELIMITFDVSQKALRSLATTPASQLLFEPTLQSFLGKDKRIETYRTEAPFVLDNAQFTKFSVHPLAEALFSSFQNHYPLELSPDDIWLTIQQQLSALVSTNPDSFKSSLVNFQDVKTLVVERNSFKKNSPNNDWDSVFEEFNEKIQEHSSLNLSKLKCDFSTSSQIHKSISSIGMMDMMKSYFHYRVHTLCGIPKIKLLGEVSDWYSLKEKAQILKALDLNWWYDKLEPLLDNLICASESSFLDIAYWQSFFKINEESGGDSITGHFNSLFPLVMVHDWKSKTQSLKKNGYFEKDYYHNTLNSFSNTYCQVPFKWKYYNTIYDMIFYGGFFGVKQKELFVSPNAFWAITDNNRKMDHDDEDLEDESEEEYLMAA